ESPAATWFRYKAGLSRRRSSFFASPLPIFDIYSAAGPDILRFCVLRSRRIRRRSPGTSLSGKSPREVQMLICDLLKNQVVISAEAHQTALELASMMVQHNIGAVPVLQEGQLTGIFSERDLMTRVVVGGKDPARTLVSQV